MNNVKQTDSWFKVPEAAASIRDVNIARLAVGTRNAQFTPQSAVTPVEVPFAADALIG